MALLARYEISTQLRTAARIGKRQSEARRYRHRPKIAPVQAAVSVKPGKYAPVGNSSEPSRSPSAATPAAHQGP